MVTVCPSQFATRRTLFHVLVGCGLLMLKVSRLKLPVIWLLVSMWLNTLTKSQIWTLLLGFENQKELTKMQLDNQKEIAEMQNETQKEIAGIQSATSRQNTKDQVYAQNEMLAYQQKESTARVASIMENTNLSK